MTSKRKPPLSTIFLPGVKTGRMLPFVAAGIGQTTTDFTESAANPYYRLGAGISYTDRQSWHQIGGSRRDRHKTCERWSPHREPSERPFRSRLAVLVLARDDRAVHVGHETRRESPTSYERLQVGVEDQIHPVLTPCLSQGVPFDARAARGSILGLIGVAAFCVAYARAARWFGSMLCLPSASPLSDLRVYATSRPGRTALSPRKRNNSAFTSSACVHVIRSPARWAG